MSGLALSRTDDRQPNPIRIIETQRSRHLQTVSRSETFTSPHKALEDADFVLELYMPTPHENPSVQFLSSQNPLYLEQPMIICPRLGNLSTAIPLLANSSAKMSISACPPTSLASLLGYLLRYS